MTKTDLAIWLVSCSPTYRKLKRSGLFQSTAYKETYVLDRPFASNPLAHYLMIGEKLGHRPNAFFDPKMMAERDVSGLYAYLVDDKYWDIPCSEEFDPTYYREHIRRKLNVSHPLLDFWHFGFDEGAGPSAVFDMAFFRRATGRDSKNLKDSALKSVVARAPRNFDELRMAQDAFYSSIELKVLKHTATDRPNLVFVQASQKHSVTFVREQRSFDILVNFYDGHGSSVPPDIETCTAQKGTKATAIRKIIEARPDFFNRYEYVLFLDDDVDIEPGVIESLFQSMKDSRLDLAQPSLSERSETFFGDLKQPRAGEGISFLTSVEIMMPCLSRRALERCGWVFEAGVSGWAIDFLLGAEVIKRCGTRPALIGSCVAEHLRPLDTEDGNFYRYLAANGIDPNIEAGAIALRYDIDDSAKAISFSDR